MAAPLGRTSAVPLPPRRAAAAQLHCKRWGWPQSAGAANVPNTPRRYSQALRFGVKAADQGETNATVSYADVVAPTRPVGAQQSRSSAGAVGVRGTAAIIGAGPAGVAAAMTLAAEGYRVHVFERRGHPGRAAAAAARTYLIGLGALRYDVLLYGFELCYMCTARLFWITCPLHPCAHSSVHSSPTTQQLSPQNADCCPSCNPIGERGLQALDGLGVTVPLRVGRPMRGSVYAYKDGRRVLDPFTPDTRLGARISRVQRLNLNAGILGVPLHAKWAAQMHPHMCLCMHGVVPGGHRGQAARCALSLSARPHPPHTHTHILPFNTPTQHSPTGSGCRPSRPGRLPHRSSC